MGHQSRQRTIKQVCEYLSLNLKQKVFDLLYSAYEKEEYLAQDIDCSVELLHKWKKVQGEVPDERYMPTILSLALNSCPEVKNLLKEDLVNKVQHLCAELDICKKNSEEIGWSKENIDLFIKNLDEKSRKIFWYLWSYGHSRLSELADFIGASTDMEVLHRLREVINPLAEKIFGRSVIEFYESKIDHFTGKKVLFNWWLMDFSRDSQLLTGEEGGKPIIDFFDEENHILIITEVSPAVRVKDIAKVNQLHGILSIRLDKLQ